MVEKFKGLVVALDELTTQFGKAYVSGEIRLTDDNKLNFKVWGCNLDTLLKSCKGLEKGVVVSISGTLESYKGVESVKVAFDEGIPCIEILEEDVNAYVYSSPLAPSKMLSAIRKDVLAFSNEVFKQLALAVLDGEKESFGYFPYSRSQHTEKGGCLYHLWLVYCNARHKLDTSPAFAKGTQLLPDVELIKTALICERYGWLTSGVEVDKVTGIVCDDFTIPETLLETWLSAFGVTKLATILGVQESIELLAIEHCLMVLANDDATPLTVEASIVRELVRSELEQYRLTETLRSMDAFEVQAGKCVCLK